MNRAVFLDRDGTVIEEVGYLNHLDRLQVYPWSAAAIRKLNQAGFLAVMITNQSGVARGYFPESLVIETHDRVKTELANSGAVLDAIYYCPHHPNGSVAEYRLQCECRKPRLGMLQRAQRELDLDLTRSFVVGDRYVDIETAFRVDAKGIFVMSGYGKGEYLHHRNTWPRNPDFIAENLLGAVEWIVQSAAGDFRQAQNC